MSSRSFVAPGFANANEIGKWDMQNYRKLHYPRNKSVDFPAPNNELVVARHIAVYNNGSTGVSLCEFEVFGTGTYLNSSIHLKFEVCIMVCCDLI